MELTSWIMLAVIVLIALAAPRYGADSRLSPSREDPPPHPGPAPERRARRRPV